MTMQFEADLDPQTGWPRIRFNFQNDWSASLVIRSNGYTAMTASVAACPGGHWGSGATQLGPTEAFADEAIAWLAEVANRPSIAAQLIANMGDE